jgi:O-antigen/teichoic acid export membrane protein
METVEPPTALLRPYNPQGLLDVVSAIAHCHRNYFCILQMIESWRLKLTDRLNHFLPEQSLRARFARGAFWSLFGTIVSRGFNFLAILLVARFLGKHGFGELGIIQSTLGMFGAFAGLGLGITATRYVAEYRGKDPSRAGRIVSLSLLVALVAGGITSLILVACAPWLAARTLAAPHLTPLLRLGALLLFCSTLAAVQTSVLAGFEAFRTIAWVNMLAGLLSFPLIVGGVWLWGLPGAIIGLVGSVGANCLINQFALNAELSKNHIRLEIAGCQRELPVLYNFSLPAFLSGVVVIVIIWISNSILVNQPEGYAEFGLLNVANQMRGYVIFISATAFQALIPILSAELNKNEDDRINFRLHILNSYATWFLATAFTAVLLYVTKPVLSLFGREFLEGNLALVLILCSIPILTYKDGIARLIVAKSLLWYGLASNVLWGFLLILFTLLLVQYGATGLGAAYLLAYFLNSAIMVPIYFKKLKMARIVRMDLQLGLYLTLALLPAILFNLFPSDHIYKLLSFILTMALLLFTLKNLYLIFSKSYENSDI